MGKLLLLTALALCVNVFADPANPTEDDAVAIVEATASDLENDTKKTLEAVFIGKDEYWPQKGQQFYVYILDEKVTMIACPMLRFMGKNYKTTKDSEGIAFRNVTVQNALKDKEGWVTFSGTSQGKIKKKKTYFKLVKDAENKNYIVCCDIDEKED